MSTLPFRQPRLVILVLLVIVSAGLSAIFSLGRQEDPTITNIFATVKTVFPGAAPARVEALVTTVLEDKLKTVPEIKVIKSTSATSVSILALELKDSVPAAAIEGVWSKIRDKITDARADFPQGVLAPDFSSDGAGAYAAIVSLTANRDDVPLTLIARQAEALADHLRNLSGTKLVETFGQPEDEVLVEVDPARAASLGLTADAISQAIARADAKVRAGRLRGEGQDLVMEVQGEITALDRLRGVVLREGAEGTTYLGDIARITRGPAAPLAEAALADGRPAILVAARIADGLQVDRWMARVRAVVAETDATLPASLRADLVFDQSGYTVERLRALAVNIGQGVTIVVAVLLLTLGLREAMIVALVLPVVGLGSMATLNFLGVPIHQMSVTGLIVALGLVVDAAIVMVDAIGHARRNGVPALAAVEGAVRRLAMPLLASTVTTMLSFVPMLLLPGPAGDFVGSIAIAVVVMLGWSFVVAVVITPALAGWWLKSREGSLRGPSRLIRVFTATVAWTARNPVRALALSLILPLAGFAAMPTLTPQFFPGVDRDQLTVEIELPEGSALAETRRVMAAMDERLAAEPEVTRTVWVAGKSAPAFYYNIVGNRDQAPGFAMALVTTASPAATDRLVPAMQSRLTDAFPEARILVKGLVQGPPVDAPVEIRLVGTDVAVLREAGDKARAIVASVPGVEVVRTSLPGGAPKLSLAVDEAQAQGAGLDLAQIARQMDASLEGATGGSMLEGTEELPVRVRMGGGLRADPEAIADLPLMPANAATLSAQGMMPALPLSAVATLRLLPGDTPVTRRNGERVNTVQAFLRHGLLPEVALANAQKALADAGFVLPSGTRIELGGDSDARDSTLKALVAPLGLIVILSLAVVVLTFMSFRLTFITFIVSGLSAGLSILALAVFGYPFGINAIIGVIGSIGVSINAAIMILSGMQENEGAIAGDPDAVAEVVAGSSRHILSTTITTFGGFLPLILAGGGFWPPFAMSIAGGVLLSSVLSFYLAPALFVLVRRRTPPAAASAPLVLYPQPHPAMAAE